MTDELPKEKAGLTVASVFSEEVTEERPEVTPENAEAEVEPLSPVVTEEKVAAGVLVNSDDFEEGAEPKAAKLVGGAGIVGAGFVEMDVLLAPEISAEGFACDFSF